MSTDEKLGAAPAPAEAPLLGDALGVLGDALELLGVELELVPPALLLPEEPLLLPVAPALEPVELDLSLLAPDEPLVCASETLASANSAAAVAVPTTFNNMRILLGRLGRTAAANDAMSMPAGQVAWDFLALSCHVANSIKTSRRRGSRRS